jgi:O-antigen/teichoic acid export membrane protein
MIPVERSEESVTVVSGAVTGSHDVAGAAARGGLLLGLRQVLTMAIAAGSAVLLARWLNVSDFGVFAQINFAVLVLAGMVIGDLGLTLALVRSAKEPATSVWASVSGLSVLLAAAAIIATFGLGVLLRLGPPLHSWWIPALGLGLAARFNRPAPSARLQRDGRYRALALGETLETVAYFGVGLSLVAAGWHVNGLVLAVLAKELIGLLALFVMVRTWVRPSWPRIKVLHSLLSVGVPYQLTGLLTMSTDAFQPVIIGWLLGSTALGYVSWAYGLILIPILVLEAVDRVIVPTLAKAQSSPPTFARWTERAMRVNGMVAFPVAAILLTTVQSIILVVFTAKWLPAAELVRQFVPAVLAVALFTPILQAFNALGRTGVALRLSILWATLTWLLGTFLVGHWGIRGYGWFYVGLQITYLPIAIIGVRTLRLSLWRAARAPMAGFLAAAGLAWIVPDTPSWSGLLIRIAIIVSAFVAGSLAVGWREIVGDMRAARRSLATSRPQTPPIDGTLQQA